MTFLLGYARINKVFSREFIVIFISNTKISIQCIMYLISFPNDISCGFLVRMVKIIRHQINKNWNISSKDTLKKYFCHSTWLRGAENCIKRQMGSRVYETQSKKSSLNAKHHLFCLCQKYQQIVWSAWWVH